MRSCADTALAEIDKPIFNKMLSGSTRARPNFEKWFVVFLLSLFFQSLNKVLLCNVQLQVAAVALQVACYK